MVKLNKTLGVIGGDLRIIRLVEILSKNDYNIYTYALGKNKFFDNKILKCKTIQELGNTCDIIISGIPFSKDGVYVNTPFANEKLEINNLLIQIRNKILIAGALQKEIKEKAEQNNVNAIDIMEDEYFTIMNVIPTVEGAMQIAMEQTEFTIHNSNCLVLGFGRIGKLLSKTLKNMGANVSCMARKSKDLAWIKLHGYKDIYIDNLENNLNGYDIIFNTIPAVILDSKKLEIIRKNNTIIIELASKPGGVNLNKALEYNINVIKAQGLPGKVAPYTAAIYIKEFLERIQK